MDLNKVLGDISTLKTIISDLNNKLELLPKTTDNATYEHSLSLSLSRAKVLIKAFGKELKDAMTLSSLHMTENKKIIIQAIQGESVKI